MDYLRFIEDVEEKFESIEMILIFMSFINLRNFSFCVIELVGFIIVYEIYF